MRRRDDVEDKLVAIVGAESWDAEKIAASVRFQEQFFDSWVEVAPEPRSD